MHEIYINQNWIFRSFVLLSRYTRTELLRNDVAIIGLEGTTFKLIVCVKSVFNELDLTPLRSFFWNSGGVAVSLRHIGVSWYSVFGSGVLKFVKFSELFRAGKTDLKCIHLWASLSQSTSNHR